MKIRYAQISDSDALLDIYAFYIKKTAITFEIAIPSPQEFSQRVDNLLTNDMPYLLMEDDDGTILGYAYAHSFSEREAYDMTVELSIYVNQKQKQRGIGHQLYQALETELIAKGKKQIIAVITGENKGSMIFHERMGYHYAGKLERVGYKFDKWHDVVYMQKTI